MISFDEMGDWLDEIAEQFPQEFYTELNGGILLSPEAMPDPEFPEGEMYFLGEYCHDEMGRTINLYYGSFAALFADASDDELYDELYTTLAHEFTHHIESLAGERGLEIKDAIELEQYREDFREKP
ncbi:MAG: metallopeptidase family protein [Oscillospiraceae bacterium]